MNQTGRHSLYYPFLGSPRVKKRLPETGANGRRRINPLPAVKNNGSNVYSCHRLLLWPSPRHNAFQRRRTEDGGLASADGGDESRRRGRRELAGAGGDLVLPCGGREPRVRVDYFPIVPRAASGSGRNGVACQQVHRGAEFHGKRGGLPEIC